MKAMQAIGRFFKRDTLGILACAAVAIVSTIISSFIPYGLISGSVFALLIGMALNPLIRKVKILSHGIGFTSKKLLKLSVILMGLSLSFSQLIQVGGFSLIVMSFTLVSAFGFGWLFGKLFKMNWKLSSLISAGTGICGGSAIAAISPVIKAKDSDVAYAIAATFLFDIVMVILFPIIGRAVGISDLGYGLWAGTAVNDTSSVVAAGFAFSDIAGNYSIIVKLTRTLSIIPIVLIFSFINIRDERLKLKTANVQNAASTVSQNAVLTVDSTVKTETEAIMAQPQRVKPNYLKIIPWFILGFLVMVALKSTGWISDAVSGQVTNVSKFLMVMALGAIGLKTNFKEMSKSGAKPMLHGFIISLLVVLVSFFVQMMFGQL